MSSRTVGKISLKIAVQYGFAGTGLSDKAPIAVGRWSEQRQELMRDSVILALALDHSKAVIRLRILWY